MFLYIVVPIMLLFIIVYLNYRLEERKKKKGDAPLTRNDALEIFKGNTCAEKVPSKKESINIPISHHLNNVKKNTTNILKGLKPIAAKGDECLPWYRRNLFKVQK